MNFDSIPNHFSKLLCENGVLLKSECNGKLPEHLRYDVSVSLPVLIGETFSQLVLKLEFTFKSKMSNFIKLDTVDSIIFQYRVTIQVVP